jgi:hypothetical protein
VDTRLFVVGDFIQGANALDDRPHAPQ